MLFTVMMLLSYFVALLCGVFLLTHGGRRDSRTEPEPPQPAPRFPQGTQIVCPKCGKHIATAKRDIYGSEPVKSAPWDGVQPDSEMRCPACTALYAEYGSWPYGLRLHTAEGWR